MSYDQWKTASPYDNDSDWIEEADKWLECNKGKATNEDEGFIYALVEGLREVISEETGL